jgi:molecular chaperone IbpA
MITLAVAGFGMDNLDITKDGNILRVEGTSPKGGENVNYLHKGIGERNFRREFTLADHVEVENAGLEHGMLNIYLKREVPEELQPKKIAINDWNGHVQEAIDNDGE